MLFGLKFLKFEVKNDTDGKSFGVALQNSFCWDLSQNSNWHY